MKKTIKKKWLAALRSGEYKKAEGVLKGTNDQDETAYCCLGVLRCVVPGLTKQRDSELLSEAACEKVGLSKFQMNMLAALNDNSPQVENENETIVNVPTVERNPRDFRRVIRYIEKHL